MQSTKGSVRWTSTQNNKGKQANHASRSVHFRTPLDTMSNGRVEQRSHDRQKRQRKNSVHSPHKRCNVDQSLYENFRNKLRPAVLPDSGPSQAGNNDGRQDSEINQKDTLRQLPGKAVNPLLHHLQNSTGVSRAQNWETLVEVAQLHRFSYFTPDTGDAGEWIKFHRRISKRVKLIREDILPLLHSWLKNPPPYQYATSVVEGATNSLNYSSSWNQDENDMISAEQESYSGAVAEWKTLKKAVHLVVQYTEFSDELLQLHVVNHPIQRYELAGLREPLANVINILISLNIGVSDRQAVTSKKSAVIPNTLQNLGTLLAVCHRNGVNDLLTIASKAGVNEQPELVSVFLQFATLKGRVLATQSLEQLKASYQSLRCANSGQPLVKEELCWNAESRCAACLALLLSNFETRHRDRMSINKDHLTMLKDIIIAEASTLNPDNSIDSVRKKQKHRKLERSWGIDSNESLVAALALSSCGDVGLTLLAEECCEHRSPAVVSVAATALAHLLVYNGLPLSEKHHHRKFVTKATPAGFGNGSTAAYLVQSWEGEDVEVYRDDAQDTNFQDSRSMTRCATIQAFIKQREPKRNYIASSAGPGASLAGDDSFFWNNDAVSEITLNYRGAKNLNQVNNLNSPRAKNIPQNSLQTNSSMLSRTMQSEAPTQYDGYESRIRSSLNRTVAGIGSNHDHSLRRATHTQNSKGAKTKYERFSRRTFSDALADNTNSPTVVLLANSKSTLNVLNNLREKNILSVDANKKYPSNSTLIQGDSCLLLFQRVLGLLSMPNMMIVRQTAVGLCDWPFTGISVTLQDMGDPVSVSVALTRFLGHVASAVSHDNDYYRNTYSYGRIIHEEKDTERAIAGFETWVRQASTETSKSSCSFTQSRIVSDIWREALRTGDLAEQRLAGCIAHRTLTISLFKSCMHFKENADTCNAAMRILRNLPPPILGGERMANWLLRAIDSLLASRFSTVRSCTLRLCHQWLKFLFKLSACSSDPSSVGKVDTEKTRWETLQSSAILPQLEKLLEISPKEICVQAQHMWKRMYSHLRGCLLECLESGRTERTVAASCLLFCGQTGLRSVTKHAREQSTAGNIRLACIHAMSSDLPLEAFEIGGRLDLSQECASLISSLTTDGNSRIRTAATNGLHKLYLRYSQANSSPQKISVLHYSSVVASLSKRLDDEDNSVAETAAQLLSEFEPQGSVILLDVLHRGKRAGARAAAASGLSCCVSGTSRPLILALSDRSEQVRNAVSLALLRKGPSKVQQELSEHSHEYLSSVLCTIRLFESEYELSTTLKSMLRNIVSFFETDTVNEQPQDTLGHSNILGELDEEESSVAPSLHYANELEELDDHDEWPQHDTESAPSPRNYPTQQPQHQYQEFEQLPQQHSATSTPTTTTTTTGQFQFHRRQEPAAASTGSSPSRRREDLYLPLDQIKQEPRQHAVGEPISPGSV